MAKNKKSAQTDLDILNETGRRQVDQPLPEGAADRRKSKRRRQIDPTTCEREYNDLEIEFMHALDEYKRASGRMFPTCSEILEVFMSLGYRKIAAKTAGFSFDEDSDSDLDSESEELIAELEV